MKPEYAVWIEQNCAGPQAGFCHSRSEAMKKAFPELILCRGYYSSPVDGSRGHWWLKTPEGEIVDPTVSQFVMGAAGVYEEYDLAIHGELPIGKCMNCGSEVFQSANPPSSCMCSEACAVSFDAYIQDEARR
jgi:hypothetical protein